MWNGWYEPTCTAIPYGAVTYPCTGRPEHETTNLAAGEKERPMKCNQDKCDNDAWFRFTWSGRDEAGICGLHAPKLRQVAEAMGLPLQLIPLEPPTCPRCAVKPVERGLTVCLSCFEKVNEDHEPSLQDIVNS